MRASGALYESIKKTIARLKLNRKPITISPSDLHESFTKSAGPGGQNVNKRDTCVRLTHLPTGVAVRSMLTSRQELNRREARRLLVAALDERVNGECSLERLKVLEEREKKRKKQSKSNKKYHGSGDGSGSSGDGSKSGSSGAGAGGSPSSDPSSSDHPPSSDPSSSTIQ